MNQIDLDPEPSLADQDRLELYRATHAIGKLKQSVAALWVFVAILVLGLIFGGSR